MTNGNGSVGDWVSKNWRAGLILALVVSGFTSLKSDVSYISNSVGEIKSQLAEIQGQSLIYRLGEAEKKIKALEDEVQALQHPTKK